MLTPSAIASCECAQRRSSARSMPAAPSAIGQVMSSVRAENSSWATWRSVSSSRLSRIGWRRISLCAWAGVSSKRLRSVPSRGREAHHDLLADRVDRRVGDLREELLEVGEQRGRLVGEDGQREVVAHRADRLGPVARHRREQHAQVLLGVAERALAGVQRLVGDRHRLGGGEVVEVHGVAHEPLAVGPAGGDLALDLAVLDDAPPLEVDEEQLAGLQAPKTPDALGRDVEQSALRAEHHEAVDGLHPAPGPQAVAVERRADHAPVGERDRGGPVPRLHQAGVEGVEVAQLLRAGPRVRGRPRGSSSSPRAAASARRASAARARGRRSRSPSRRP